MINATRKTPDARRMSLKSQLRFEQLESRKLFSADVCSPFSELGVDAFGLMSVADESPMLGSEGLGWGGLNGGGTANFDVSPVKPKGFPPTHSFLSDGVEQWMGIDPDQIALGLDPSGSTGIEALIEGAVSVRPVTEGIVIYSGPGIGEAAMRQFFNSVDGVTVVAPVFVMQEIGSEAVLLDEVIIALREGISAEEFFAGDLRFASYRPLLGTHDQFIATVASGVGESALAINNEVQGDSRVLWAAPNFYEERIRTFQPNDSRFGNLWHLNNTGAGNGVAGEDVSALEAWDIVRGGSADLVIGIVDDGIDQNHPDLNQWINPGEVPGNGIDDDGNGWVDDVNGWNFVSNNNNAGPTFSSDAHGTSVAGVAAARGNNGIGVTGASYGTPVMSARIFEGDNVASNASIASAIYYVSGRTANGQGTWNAADIANHSWRGGSSSTAINAALTWATGSSARGGLGVTQMIASGNDYSSTVAYPANQSATNAGVLAVGAHTNSGLRSSYSNYGTALDIMAPSSGGSLRIDTTDQIGSWGYSSGDYTGTGSPGFGGTSSATPLATGVAALALARAETLDVDLSASDIKKLLRSNTDLIGPLSYSLSTGKNNEYGFGRINAAKLVAGIGTAEISVVSSYDELESGTGELNFGIQDLGSATDLTLRVRNQGTEPLVLSDLSIPAGPFSIQESFGTTTLAIGEATTFTVRYEASPGIVERDLTIRSNDADEAVFTVNLRGQGRLPMIGGRIFEDANGDGSYSLGDSALDDQRVFIDSNDNDTYDEGWINQINETDVTISDYRTVTSTVTISGVDTRMPWTYVQAYVNIEHTYTGDLTLKLKNPAGQSITLASRLGGSGDNYSFTLFDDDADQSILTGSAPFSDTYRPQEPLSRLMNGNPNGVWELSVTDSAGGDTGVLTAWGVEVGIGEHNAVLSDGGYYGFSSIPVGTHVVRTETPAGWTLLAPQSAEHVVVIESPGDTITGKDFAQAKNNRFYASVFDDRDGDGVRDQGEPGLAQRFLFVDVNEDGIYQEGSENSYLNSTPVDILDRSTVTSTIEVPAGGEFITDIDVRVDIQHTFNADLDVFLVGPGGERVELFTDVGSSNDNFSDTILDDQAEVGIASGTAPFNGRYRPEGGLGTFNGLSAGGVWTLEITDDAGGDVGRLLEWELIVTTGEVGVETDSFGHAAIDLNPGTWNLMLVEPEGWSMTSPSTGYYRVTVDGVPLVGHAYGASNSSGPTDIQIDNNSVNENRSTANRVRVGQFTATDPTAGDTHSFAIVAGAGDADNSRFEIVGNELFVKPGVILDHENQSTMTVRVRATDSSSLSFEKAFVIQVADLAEIDQIVIADGTSQRSMVSAVTVEFDNAVTIDQDAFSVVKRGNGGGSVAVSHSTQTVDGKTVATLTFSGNFVSSGSLVDGNYTLTIDASKITDSLGNALDGDRDGTHGGNRQFGASEADSFYRLFGDRNGDRAVGFADFVGFRNAFGSSEGDSAFDSLYDSNDDGSIGFSDFVQFRNRFGSTLNFE